MKNCMVTTYVGSIATVIAIMVSGCGSAPRPEDTSTAQSPDVTVSVDVQQAAKDAQTAPAECATNADCEDSNPCTKDYCKVGGICQHDAQEAQCSDGEPCTIGDACVNGGCVGTKLNCDDGLVCTDDSCSTAGKCNHALNSVSCTDGNPCTVGDICANAACVPGKKTNCDDGNPCTNDSCDQASGACLHVANTLSCDDGNDCTSGDVCVSGACFGQAKVCDDNNVCTDDACEGGVCVKFINDAPCTDGNACTTGDHCQNGECAKIDTDCNDSNPCTGDWCDPKSGKCLHADNTLPCNDNDNCTVSDICAAGICAGTELNCTDGQLCTDDSCNNGICVHALNNALCDDGNPCTTGDSCVSAKCVGSLKNCDDANPCTDDSCDIKGNCANIDNSVICSDGNACTTGDTCASGKCVGAVTNCSDGNDCTTDKCVSTTGGCMHYVDNTASCSDSNACTSGDSCVSANCIGKLTDCDDSNPCTDDSCDPKSGKCLNTNNSAPCFDNDNCTVVDTCVAGKCVGGEVKKCSDGNVCTDDSCEQATGNCLFAINSNTCSDGNACTNVDLCVNAACVAGLVTNCSDGNALTFDACDTVTGKCLHSNVPFPTCPVSCDDNNSCTNDSCDTKTGACLYAANSAPCDDKNPCTVGDTCSQTACLPGIATLTCDDGIAVTVDSCDPVKGCININPNQPPLSCYGLSFDVTVTTAIEFWQAQGNIPTFVSAMNNYPTSVICQTLATGGSICTFPKGSYNTPDGTCAFTSDLVVAALHGKWFNGLPTNWTAPGCVTLPGHVTGTHGGTWDDKCQ